MTHPTDEERENRNRKASAAMRGMHKTACYEQGDHPDECDSYFSLAADALDAIAAQRAQLAAAIARAVRAEAALAAQIEAAIREIWCLCEDLEDEAHAKLKLKLTEHEQGFWAAQKMTAKRIRRATQMPTNDRTALDRLLADAEAKASANALRRVVELPHRIESLGGQNYAYVRVEEILALIPKEGKQ